MVERSRFNPTKEEVVKFGTAAHLDLGSGIILHSFNTLNHDIFQHIKMFGVMHPPGAGFRSIQTVQPNRAPKIRGPTFWKVLLESGHFPILSIATTLLCNQDHHSRKRCQNA